MHNVILRDLVALPSDSCKPREQEIRGECREDQQAGDDLAARGFQSEACGTSAIPTQIATDRGH